MKLRFATAALLMLSVGAASAQQNDVRVFLSAPSAQKPADQVRVSLSSNLFVPSPPESSDEGFKAQENARRKMYEMSVRECELLREVIASECRIETINVTINRARVPQQLDGFTIGANMSFRITLK